MATGKQPSGNIGRAANVIENQADTKETQMLKFYYSGAPNPTKVALFLEETGYEPVPIDTRKGEQHKPEFLAINPNAKLPAIVEGNVTVFDSSAILLYLAEKTGKFLPAKTDKARAELLSWMFFVSSGVGPPPVIADNVDRRDPNPSRGSSVPESSPFGNRGLPAARCLAGAPEEIRTPDPQIRSLALCPPSARVDHSMLKHAQTEQ